MNKTNWQAFGSFLWSALLAVCIASTIMEACAPSQIWLLLVLLGPAWIILRTIRHFTVKNWALFAGTFYADDPESFFTFILDGVISCFILGRKIPESDDLLVPITTILGGILFTIFFLKDVFSVIKKHYETAQLAISDLEKLRTQLKNEETKHISIRDGDGSAKDFHCVPAESEVTK